MSAKPVSKKPLPKEPKPIPFDEALRRLVCTPPKHKTDEAKPKRKPKDK